MKFEENRRQWMRHPMSYPYWKYPKGAAKLVAANTDGSHTPAPGSKPDDEEEE